MWMKKGFTLVELLVVMAIVGFLSLLAVGSYLEYRRISLINLAADNFVSQINQVRTKAVYGVFDKDANVSPECFGISFERGPDSWQVSKFTVPYNPQKEWNVDKQDWVVKGCDLPNKTDSGPFEKDESVNVFVSLYDDIDGNYLKNGDDFMVLFMPPKGQAIATPLLVNTDRLTTVLRYGASNSSRYQSGFIIDLNSGQASKLSYEDLDKIPDHLLNY